jgi:Type VI secretion system/phage-baseplate injector OB domain
MSTLSLADELLARLADKVDHRYWGKYRAFVADNNDPQHLGRLRLKIPGVLGPDVVTGWALPCAPYGGASNQGFFFIPDRDACVWAEFECGLLEFPIWTGAFWSKPGGTSEVPEPARTQSPPASKMIRTAKHTIELADGDKAIKITDVDNDNKVTMDSNGILIEHGTASKVRLDSNGVVIDTTGKIKIGGGALDLEKLVKGGTLKNLLTAWHGMIASHVHPNGNMGSPTLAAVTLATPPDLTSALSQKHIVE